MTDARYHRLCCVLHLHARTQSRTHTSTHARTRARTQGKRRSRARRMRANCRSRCWRSARHPYAPAYTHVPCTCPDARLRTCLGTCSCAFLCTHLMHRGACARLCAHAHTRIPILFDPIPVSPSVSMRWQCARPYTCPHTLPLHVLLLVQIAAADVCCTHVAALAGAQRCIVHLYVAQLHLPRRVGRAVLGRSRQDAS